MLELDKILTLIDSAKKSAATTPGGRIDRTAQAIPDGDGEEYVPVGIDGVLAASGKLLAVNRGEAGLDNRDSLAFKRTVTVDRMLRERIRMDSDRSGKKLMRALARKRNLEGMAPFHFDNYATGLLIGNPLSSPMEEINPMHIVEQARRMTLMGPGGVGSKDAITSGMQNVDASQFGFIDPLAGPESEQAGVDTRLAFGVRIGSDGRLYQKFRNRRTGGDEWLSPDQIDGKTVKLPD